MKFIIVGCAMLVLVCTAAMVCLTWKYSIDAWERKNCSVHQYIHYEPLPSQPQPTLAQPPSVMKEKSE